MSTVVAWSPPQPLTRNVRDIEATASALMKRRLTFGAVTSPTR